MKGEDQAARTTYPRIQLQTEQTSVLAEYVLALRLRRKLKHTTKDLKYRDKTSKGKWHTDAESIPMLAFQ